MTVIRSPSHGATVAIEDVQTAVHVFALRPWQWPETVSDSVDRFDVLVCVFP